MHFRLGLNVRHADEQLRGTLMLPHGTGKEVRIAVFAEGDKAREAQDAGADVVGSADLAKRIEEGWTEFDVAIATPDQMGNVGRLGRILGPRGLMPNPKTGTVTFDVGKAVSDAKAGKLEYRTDRGANVHVSIGKKSFDERALVENYAAVLDEIVRAKPAAAKGRYIRQITITSTMGPGIRIDPAKNKVTAKLNLEHADWLTPTADALWISSETNSVYRLDPRTLQVTAAVPVGQNPLASTMIGTDLWVPNIDSNTVSVVDTTTATVTDTIPVGQSPIAVVHEGGDAWVTSEGDGDVWRVGPTADRRSVADKGAVPKGCSAA